MNSYEFIRPNWQHEDEYPQHDQPYLWAWEFLRRNAEYQRRYAEYAAVAETLSGGAERTGEHAAMVRDFCIWGYDTSAEKNVIAPPHPGQDVTYLRFNDFNAPRYAVRGREHAMRREIGPHEVHLYFDLRGSIPEQIRYAEELLRLFKSKEGLNPGHVYPQKRKRAAELHPLYLRVLDADAASARHAEMRDVLFPGERDPGDALKQARAAARRLRDADYRNWLTYAVYANS